MRTRRPRRIRAAIAVQGDRFLLVRTMFPGFQPLLVKEGQAAPLTHLVLLQWRTPTTGRVTLLHRFFLGEEIDSVQLQLDCAVGALRDFFPKPVRPHRT